MNKYIYVNTQRSKGTWFQEPSISGKKMAPIRQIEFFLKRCARYLVLVFLSTLFKSLLLVTTLVFHEMSRGETVFQYEVTAILVQERQDIASVTT